MSFFSELRRRNVFKVGAAYAIVAWLLIQVADAVLPTFNSPAWVMQVFTFFMILGFPITLLMAWAYEMTPEGIKAAANVQPTATLTPATGQRLNYVILGLVVLAVGFLALDRFVLAPRAGAIDVARSVATVPTRDQVGNGGAIATAGPVRRSNYLLGTTRAITNTALHAHVALSRDGRRLAYAADSDGTLRLYVRELNQLQARAIPDTEGAEYPFFSPDGEWVVFSSDVDNKLSRVAFRGGPVQRLVDTQGSSGGFWGDDDNIVYGNIVGGVVRSLFRVPAGGGTPELLIDPEPDVGGHTWSARLPGGKSFLFVLRPGRGGTGPIRDGRIAVLSLESREYRVLIDGGHRPQYASTGHIVFVRAGGLWAVPFDAERLEITGPEVRVIDSVQQNGLIGGAAYAFSDDGLLVYLPGGDIGGATPDKELLWVDRQGNEEPLGLETRQYWFPRLSHDGQRLATTVGSGGYGGRGDIWIYDLQRRTSSRLTTDGGHNTPIWTPNDQSVIFWSSRGNGEAGIFSQAPDGAGQAERLTTSSATQVALWSIYGTQLVLSDPYTPSGDIHLLSLEGEPATRRLIPPTASPTWEGNAAVSPNGRWIAYDSDETGESQIYVQSFPNVDEGRVTISIDGGNEPVWSRDGTELFFRNGDAVMAVGVEDDEAFSPGAPEVLFTGSYWSAGDSTPNYDVAADGRFLMMRSAGASGQGAAQALEQTLLVTVENWFEELRRLAPPSR